MSRDRRPDDEVYRAVIMWDVPNLRNDGGEDAREFLRTLELAPGTLQTRPEDATRRMSALRRATLALQSEMQGGAEEARELYSRVARLPGYQGLLGTLLLAWMSDAKPSDFTRVEKRLQRMSQGKADDLVALCHCKLATWSRDQGWTELSAYYFDLAHRHAGVGLRMKLESIAHWFGREQRIHFGHSRRAEISDFTWIVERAEFAARRTLEKNFKESFRSPWRRVWSFGAGAPEGSDIQSAELQASWAGAMWIIPSIQRQHAAQILMKSRAAEDVSRAIALWVRGGGESITALIDSLEGYLTGSAVEDLLMNQLRRGRTVASEKHWWETCHALWSELPQALVDEFVATYSGPSDELEPRDDDATPLSLFAHLAARSAEVSHRASEFDERQLAYFMRTFPTDLLEHLSPPLRERGLRAISAHRGHGSDWESVGWATIARAWSLLPHAKKEALRAPLLDLLPEQLTDEAAAVAPEFVPVGRQRVAMNNAVERIRADIANATRGRFVGYVSEPAVRVARLAVALRAVPADALDTLVELASIPAASSSQRQAALNALVFLAREGLLTDVAIGEQVFDAPSAFRFASDDDPDVEQRFEDVLRTALRLTFRYSDEHDGRLLAGSRDPNARVRKVAIDAIQWTTTHGSCSSALDAALLGALYDPHPRVQAAAVPALWRGRFASETIREVAHDRLLDMWPNAHVDVRLAIAKEVGSARWADGHIERIAALAVRDRSSVVRSAVVKA